MSKDLRERCNFVFVYGMMIKILNIYEIIVKIYEFSIVVLFKVICKYMWKLI